MIFQWSMYLLSYSPLWVCVLFINILNLVNEKNNTKVELLSVIVIPIAFLLSFAVMKRKLNRKTIGTQSYILKSATEEKLITAEFLFTFILPLLAFDFTTWKGMTLFLFFFFVFGFLCVRHNYFCTNIVLDLCKYRIYSCNLANTNDDIINKKIISRHSLETKCNEKISTLGLNNDYSFDCKIR